MNWQSTCQDTVEDCAYTASYGMQYTKLVKSIASAPLTLAHLLPCQVGSLQPHLLTDTTSLQVVVPNNKAVAWYPSCAGPPSSVNFSAATSTLKKAVAFTDDCFGLRRADKSFQDSYWRVHFDLLRPSGQANRGTLHTLVRNDHDDCSVHVALLQSLPDVFEPVWQSLVLVEKTEDAFTKIQWTGDLEWKNNSIILSWDHALPPRSSLFLALDYDPAFLSINSFPADANRGIELPPVLAIFEPSQCQAAKEASIGTTVTLWSNPLLILPPLPDQSMPFNVLSLTGTLVYAFVIGSFLNLVIRKASIITRPQQVFRSQ